MWSYVRCLGGPQVRLLSGGCCARARCPTHVSMHTLVRDLNIASVPGDDRRIEVMRPAPRLRSQARSCGFYTAVEASPYTRTWVHSRRGAEVAHRLCHPVTHTIGPMACPCGAALSLPLTLYNYSALTSAADPDAAKVGRQGPLRFARRTKERTYPELMQGNSRWSPEAV